MHPRSASAAIVAVLLSVCTTCAIGAEAEGGGTANKEASPFEVFVTLGSYQRAMTGRYLSYAFQTSLTMQACMKGPCSSALGRIKTFDRLVDHHDIYAASVVVPSLRKDEFKLTVRVNWNTNIFEYDASTVSPDQIITDITGAIESPIPAVLVAHNAQGSQPFAESNRSSAVIEVVPTCVSYTCGPASCPWGVINTVAYYLEQITNDTFVCVYWDSQAAVAKDVDIRYSADGVESSRLLAGTTSPLLVLYESLLISNGNSDGLTVANSPDEVLELAQKHGTIALLVVDSVESPYIPFFSVAAFLTSHLVLSVVLVIPFTHIPELDLLAPSMAMVKSYQEKPVQRFNGDTKLSAFVQFVKDYFFPPMATFEVAACPKALMRGVPLVYVVHDLKKDDLDYSRFADSIPVIHVEFTLLEVNVSLAANSKFLSYFNIPNSEVPFFLVESARPLREVAEMINSIDYTNHLMESCLRGEFYLQPIESWDVEFFQGFFANLRERYWVGDLFDHLRANEQPDPEHEHMEVREDL